MGEAQRPARRGEMYDRESATRFAQEERARLTREGQRGTVTTKDYGIWVITSAASQLSAAFLASIEQTGRQRTTEDKRSAAAGGGDAGRRQGGPKVLSPIKPLRGCLCTSLE
jgi:hypothetical protein